MTARSASIIWHLNFDHWHSSLLDHDVDLALANRLTDLYNPLILCHDSFEPQAINLRYRNFKRLKGVHE
jgi:hypothetical protein